MANSIPPKEPNPSSKQATVKATPSRLWPHASLDKTTRPVNVQTIIVSKNTSNMPQKPCSTAFTFTTAACDKGELPIPASLENTPRDMP